MRQNTLHRMAFKAEGGEQVRKCLDFISCFWEEGKGRERGPCFCCPAVSTVLYLGYCSLHPTTSFLLGHME
jgi:hypothetical protein